VRVLITGGTGYIGSHTAVELISAGHEPVIVDNLSNSSRESLNRISQITGTDLEFHEFDVCDTRRLTRLLKDRPCDVAFHFAGLKAVGESVEQPLRYYRNNIDSTLSLTEALISASTPDRPPRIIFSSSATVYGEPQFLPITEKHQVGQGITNPYGMSKYICEQILSDTARVETDFQALAMRYFNPIGAHSSGLIGEDPRDRPNNLAPYVAQVAVGRREYVNVYGSDYETVDGTGVRDYIHVMDLASGHVAALNFSSPGFHAVNLGTGVGTSVIDFITTFETASGKTVPTRMHPRRTGDVAISYASPALAHELLDWHAKRSVADACADSWRWQSLNPDGFGIPPA
jgi:UDP-glucose 4-epimerase